MNKRTKPIKMNKRTKPIKMNLQLFAEGETVNQEQPIVQQPQQQQQKSADLLNMISEVKNQVSGLSNQFSGMQQQKSAEQVQAEQEQLLEELNSNPGAVLDRIKSSAIKDARTEIMNQVNPVIDNLNSQMQSMAWSDAVRKFVGNTPAAAQYSAEMNQVLASDPTMAALAKQNPQQALNMAFSQAVANKVAPNGDIVAGITGNEAILNQILSNPDLQAKFQAQYLQQLNGTQPDVPPLMGNASSGPGIAPTQTNKPTNMQEARKAAEARIAMATQNQMQ